MKFSFNLRKSAAGLYDRLWHVPKGKLSSRLKDRCEKLTPKQRMTTVTVMLTLFIVTAFVLLGRACYRMGAGQAGKNIEVQHIQQLDVAEKQTEVKPATYSHEVD